ncbi:FliA/WhiG family RNA polymerase sigma factor [bacterium]|nr:FliA/WhiG family RNA polymerase sigma factor [bacterium]
MRSAVETEKKNEVSGMWNRYINTKDEALKKEIVVQYLGLVKFVIARMFSHLPSYLSLEDLENTGIIGLIDAVDRFDPYRGIKFETFAVPRIKGAILDELRSYDFLPRTMRAKVKEVQKAVQLLEKKLQRSPSEDEIASELRIEISKYRAILGNLSPIRFLSLSDIVDGRDEGRIATNLASQTYSRENRINVEQHEVKKILVQAIQNLPKNERLTIALYYYEEMTMKEIAVVLKVSESRVSQIHTQALIKLRSAMETALKD